MNVHRYLYWEVPWYTLACYGMCTHSIEWLPLQSTSRPFQMFVATFWQIMPKLSKAIMAGKDQIAMIYVHGTVCTCTFIHLYIYICMYVCILWFCIIIPYRFLWPDWFCTFEWRYVKKGKQVANSAHQNLDMVDSCWIYFSAVVAAARFMLGTDIGFWGEPETSAQVWMKT